MHTVSLTADQVGDLDYALSVRIEMIEDEIQDGIADPDDYRDGLQALRALRETLLAVLSTPEV